MKSAADDEAEQLGDYHDELRRRANHSIQQLSCTLDPLHQRDGGEEGEGRGPRPTPRSPRSLLTPMDEDKPAWSQKTQSEAVNQLKSLLLKQGKDTTSAPPQSKKHSPSKQQESVHHSHDLVPTSHNQTEYIQHLEAEVKLCKDELQGLKKRVNVVVVENERLQTDLRSKAADESLKAHMLNNSMVNESTTANSHTPEHTTWKNELEHLKVIHKAQIETLEAQVISLRKGLSLSQRECEELKVRLIQKEKEAADALRADGAPRVAGLCLKCAQHESVLANAHSNQHVQTINRLTKERDELLVSVRGARAAQQEEQQKLRSACFQVQQAVQMVEEANFRKAQMELQCEQMSREVAQHRQRSEQECQAFQKRLNEARDEGRAEVLKKKEELAHTVAKLTRDVAEVEGQVDRAQRDKSSLTNQLEEARCKLSSQEQEKNKACADLRYQLGQAQMKRDEAERKLRELGTKADMEMEKTKQEVERLSSELVGCRQRLEAVQRDGSQWQAAATGLAEQLASAQDQLHLTRQKTESAEQSHCEEMARVTRSAQEKHRELRVLLEHAEAGNQHRVTELESLLGSQNSLIRKLKKECCMLGSKLEELTENSRSDLQQLTLEKRRLEETAKSLRARCSDMEDQCVQHGRMHQRMRTRLQQLDGHCRSSAQQVCELLAKQSQLMREKKTLAEEMRDLHAEVPVYTLTS